MDRDYLHSESALVSRRADVLQNRAGNQSRHSSEERAFHVHASDALPLQRNIVFAIVLLLLYTVALLLIYRFGQSGNLPNNAIIHNSISSADYSRAIMLVNLAGWFLFFAFWRRHYIVCVIGLLFASVGMGEAINQASSLNGASTVGVFLGTIALGCLIIHLISRTLFNTVSLWTIYIAIILTLLSVSVITIGLSWFLASWLIWAPLLLVGAGVYLGFIRNL